MIFSTGDIILGTDRRPVTALHPILFIREGDSPDFFVGVMLTHSPNYGNIPLPEEYFQNLTDYDPADNHFVRSYLLKKNEWGPYRKVGEVSSAGIEYVGANIDLKNPIIWDGKSMVPNSI